MNKGVKAGLLLLLFANLAYVFFQQYHNVFDGDLVGVVLPSDSYRQVLHDPLGLEVLLKNAHYPAPNRFVPHWLVYKYFRTVPLLFQHFSTPINSIYLACTLAKTLILALIIYVLSATITGRFNPLDKNFLLVAVLITPLFQTGGYCWEMGIIDPCICFNFVYSLSAMLIILFFLPFFLSTFHQQQVRYRYPLTISLMFLALVNAFGGPLNPPLIIMICFLILTSILWKKVRQNKSLPFTARVVAAIKTIPAPLLFIFSFAVFLSFYSFFIGRNNLESFVSQISLTQRYAKLPRGVFEQFTSKPFLMLFTMIAINLAIIFNKRTDPKARRILQLFLWIMLFSLLFVLLLPLGGYRFYRPNIVRRDTIVPITLSLITFYGLSTFYILKNISYNYKRYYWYVVIIPLLHFAAVNTYNMPNNSCEKNALMEIAASKEKIVFVDRDCTVLSWTKITDYRESKDITDLLRYWNIISEEKYFYQK